LVIVDSQIADHNKNDNDSQLKSISYASI